MTLEDQIRRMGEARATEVATPPWRERLGGRRPRLLLAAVALIALVAVIGALVLNRDDTSPADVAGPDGRPVSRWVPAGGVWEVAYGATPAALFFSVPGQEVGLVTTAADATLSTDDDWTWINVGPLPLVLSLAEDGDPGPRDGYFQYRTDDGLNVTIASERLTEADLRGIEAALRGTGNSAASIASTIAGLYDDLSVVYAGPSSAPPTQVSAEPELDGQVVWWIDEPDAARYMASYRWLLTPDGNEIGALFALSADATMNQEFASMGIEDTSESVTEEEWLRIIDGLLGDEPTVEARDINSPDILRVFEPASPTAELVSRDDGASSVRIRFDQPVTVRDGGQVELSIGPRIKLAFWFEPGVAHDSVELEARLAESEAQRYVNAINGSASRPAAATTTVPRYPVTPQFGVCAANPAPTDDVLDRATHIAFDRTPLDLDQDGVEDELMIYDDADGNWFLLARLQTGWTNALAIGAPSPPGLAQTSDGVPAGTDLDGDGQLEFFITGYLGPSAQLVTLRDCELVDTFFVDEPAEGLGASVGVQIGFSDDTPLCQGRACATRVSCAGGVLTQEVWIGAAANDEAGEWGIGELRLDGTGIITTTELPTKTVGPFDTLDDPPTEATTGVIECSPEQDGNVANIARPECAANDAPPDGSIPALVPDGSSFDVDNDGFDDEMISFLGDDGEVRLTLHLGDGNYTNAVPIWFNPPGNGFRPGLVQTPEGEVAMADLTGNGFREFFVGIFGNTARSTSPIGLDGCDLRWFGESAEDPEDTFRLVIGVGGNSCAPTGCIPRLSCVDGDLVHEITGPAGPFDPDQPADEIEATWTTTVYRHVDGAFVAESESETAFLISEPPPDAPSITDVVDCSPR